MKKEGLLKSIYSLSLANIISVLATMCQGMILARVLSKFDYGTYSQAQIVFNLFNVIFGLGLNNAINYFIPKSENEQIRQKYTDTIFGIIIILGILAGISIVLLTNPVVLYFNNIELKSILIFISIRPLLYSINNAFINLFIANNYTSLIAKRNIMINICTLVIVGILSITVQSVKGIYIGLILLDMFQVMYLYKVIKNKGKKINIFKLEKRLIKDILVFSVPLAIALASGTLIKQMDTLIIGNFYSTEQLAEYAIVGKELPFAFFATAIVTVIRPYIVKFYNEKNLKQVSKIWSYSIELAALITCIMCFTALLVSKELLIILYSEKYVTGLRIFNIYIILQMTRFTYFGMVLNSAGKSTVILYYSILTLIINFILNYVLILTVGYIGPALASLLSQLIINLLQLLHSSKILKCNLLSIVNYKKIGLYVIVLSILAIGMYNIKLFIINSYISSHIVILFLFGGLYCILAFLLFYRRIIYLSTKLKKVD